MDLTTKGYVDDIFNNFIHINVVRFFNESLIPTLPM